MRHPLLALVVGALCLTAACTRGGEPDRVGVRDSRDPASTLTVTLAADAKGTGARTWTLTCEPAGGDHPDPGGACRALAALKDPFAPLSRDLICTEIYGGSAVARIMGTWRGAPVDATYTRQDGCHISQYDGLGPVLPGPVPGQPTP